jgi:GLPGLI family protein
LVTYFDYVFERTRSLYKPEYTETGNKHVLLDVLPAADNTVFRDAGSGIETKEKKVYSKTYFIRDSLTDFKWTITDEKRNIAGFECRKAVGMLMDSIPVIAFYSEEFLTSGGPESFAGLPGMILGVAVPRLHTTWYAVNVETGKTEVNWNHATPADGKYMDRKIYLQAVRQEFKGDRSLIERFIGWVML